MKSQGGPGLQHLQQVSVALMQWAMKIRDISNLVMAILQGVNLEAQKALNVSPQTSIIIDRLNVFESHLRDTQRQNL